MSNRKRKYSIYVDEVTNIIDWENKTIKIEIIKHINKCKVDRGWKSRRKGWNKSGLNGRSQDNLHNRQTRYNTKKMIEMNYEYEMNYDRYRDW